MGLEGCGVVVGVLCGNTGEKWCCCIGSSGGGETEREEGRREYIPRGEGSKTEIYEQP